MEVINRGLKQILERTVGVSRKDWAEKLDDALWAFRMAYRTLTSFTPYRLIFGKACYLPVELEHKTLWALKTCNFDVVNIGTMAERRERPRKVGLSKRRRSYPIDQPAPTLAPPAPAPRPKGP
ncbi:uncharacterized protein LOC107262269 [Ricinus communis]|uniref:uncharacterized protein LOC107262269 n=1 Tax=Ricinus communis TaxID=3988 RepID=UPI00201A4DBB|nr:uncharacterized protein LOC107262269 [Ricinus communis]